MPADATPRLCLEQTTHIVARYVDGNAVRRDRLPTVIASVHAALARVSQADESSSDGPVPAIAPSRAVSDTAVACLVCGARRVSLKQHLRAAHGLSPDAYRTAFGLPASLPLVAPDLSRRRAALARRQHRGRRADG